MIPLLLIAAIEIQLPPCRPDWLDADALRILLSAETATNGFSQLAFAIPDCERAPEELQLTITSSIGSASRVVSFSDVPKNARLRALAVTIGELEIRPIFRAPSPTRTARDRGSRRIIDHTTRLSASAGGRAHPTTETVAWLVRAGLTHLLGISVDERFALLLAFDLTLARAARSFSQGEVRLELYGFRAGVVGRYRFAPFVVDLALGSETGWARALGSAASGDVIASRASELVSAGVFSASIAWAWFEAFGAFATTEVGWTAIGLRATIDGEAGLGWQGPFGGITAGLWVEL